jgi:DNA-binding transcriptional regulator GbsR (MarR family)
VSVKSRLDAKRLDTEVMDFVEQMGGYFESNGLTRLAGRLLGWLLVCDPERQSSEELAVALNASSGGISTNGRLLIQFGFIERLAGAGDRRTYFRLRPNAFAAGERQRIRTMADMTAMADTGLRAMRGSSPERTRRLKEMRTLSSYMEKVLTAALDEFGDPRREDTT